MSNCYTECCFSITVTPEEAALLQAALDFHYHLESEPEDPDADWLNAPEELRLAFPAEDPTKPLSGFLSIFPDPDWPLLGATFTFEPTEDGNVTVTAHGEDFEPDPVASLLSKTITQSLPIAVTWATYSDRHSPDHATGGGFRIDHAGIHWRSASDVFRNDQFAPRLVLATLDPDGGLLFWSAETGFGDLHNATVYSEAEAETVTVIANDEPAWLQLPPY